MTKSSHKDTNAVAATVAVTDTAADADAARTRAPRAPAVTAADRKSVV